MEKQIFSLFKKGSTTYFYSSVFFPPNIRREVFILYAFVRKADDFVDAVPQQTDSFYRFVSTYHAALAGTAAHDVVIDSFVDLMKRNRLERDWTHAFLTAMELDITKKRYQALDETIAYMYGSAEVIGLFMARLLDLPAESYPAAQMQGRAMQYINFIRDIAEDLQLGRTYLPLHGSGLESLDESHTSNNQECFRSFIRSEIDRYRSWQRDAEMGYHFIPRRYRIAIKTASDMYRWTAEQIYRDPFIVYRMKVKPTISRIVLRALVNTIRIIMQ